MRSLKSNLDILKLPLSPKPLSSEPFSDPSNVSQYDMYLNGLHSEMIQFFVKNEVLDSAQAKVILNDWKDIPHAISNGLNTKRDKLIAETIKHLKSLNDKLGDEIKYLESPIEQGHNAERFTNISIKIVTTAIIFILLATVIFITGLMLMMSGQGHWDRNSNMTKNGNMTDTNENLEIAGITLMSASVGIPLSLFLVALAVKLCCEPFYVAVRGFFITWRCEASIKEIKDAQRKITTMLRVNPCLTVSDGAEHVAVSVIPQEPANTLYVEMAPIPGSHVDTIDVGPVARIRLFSPSPDTEKVRRVIMSPAFYEPSI